jgi:hypothetical protein
LWQSSRRYFNKLIGIIFINKLCLCFTLITCIATLDWLILVWQFVV